MGYRISVDTGGTFTDAVVADRRGIRAIGKALTTPQRIFDGMRAAIEVASEECSMSVEELLRQADMLIYGTTRATNAVVTQSTAKTAFLTTRGFRDILVLREGGKYNPHDYSYDYPPPYIPRRYTFEIDERIDSQGNVVRVLDREQARALVRTLKQRKFEAVAVSLMWSIANGAHERAIANILDEELPGVPYSLSHELIPIVREYRRASTTAVDASLKPLMQEHLRQMEQDLRASGFAGELLIGTSGGG
ncbi:MAG: 5-oxoprolinase, partial [Proteobacteria bacterium]